MLAGLEKIQAEFNKAQSGGKKISLADLIVLGGCAAVEKAAKKAGVEVTVPFAPGRTDASQEQTDIESFAVLEPAPTGSATTSQGDQKLSPETLLLDRANLLIADRAGDDGARRWHAGARRELRADQAWRVHRSPRHARRTTSSSTCSTWASSGSRSIVRRRLRRSRRATGEAKWTATAVDLVFGSNSQLRAHRRGLRSGRREGEVRARLRRGVEQGHEPRSLRPPRRLTPACISRRGLSADARGDCRGRHREARCALRCCRPKACSTYVVHKILGNRDAPCSARARWSVLMGTRPPILGTLQRARSALKEANASQASALVDELEKAIADIEQSSAPDSSETAADAEASNLRATAFSDDVPVASGGA